MSPSFRDLFDQVRADLFGALSGSEFATLWFEAEQSQFIRLNRARVRQAGRVDRPQVSIRLVDEGRQATEAFVPSLNRNDDRGAVLAILERLREQVSQAAPDPFMMISREASSSDSEPAIAGNASDDELFARANSVVQALERSAIGRDLVGFLADGPLFRGFASSAGARHWLEARTTSLDFSIYVDPQRAVKRQIAGATLSPAQIDDAVSRAARLADWLSLPAVDIAPGRYRTLFEPAAMAELLSMFRWDAFSMRAFKTGQSPLMRFHNGEVSFSPLVTVAHGPEAAMAPRFQSEGFISPSSIPLITSGQQGALLVSPRSEKEFGVTNNGMGGGESPSNIILSPGALVEADALAALGTGLWIGNLWYLNWSDRTSARVTGMTRFASFWVENGRVVGPINKVRFDDSLYSLFGDALEALGSVAEFMPDTSTYDGRVTASTTAPVGLVSGFAVTL